MLFHMFIPSCVISLFYWWWSTSFTHGAALESMLSKQLITKSQPELINFTVQHHLMLQNVIATARTFCAVILPACAALPRRQVFAFCAAISQTFSAGGLLMSHGAATSSSWGKLFMWLLTQLTLPERWAKRVWVEALSHPWTNNVCRHIWAGEAAHLSLYDRSTGSLVSVTADCCLLKQHR